MTTYVVGDVQGCFDTLQKLIEKLDFSPSRDRLIFAGDLVNRGPKSLETIRSIINMGDAASCVLGNHDIYLLMCASGGRQLRTKDNFDDILNADDAKPILKWLARQPLIIQEGDFTIVHAGLLPEWSIQEAHSLSQEFSRKLQDLWNTDNIMLIRDFFEELWCNTPTKWHDGLTQIERYRLTVNGMTRVRLLDEKGGMNFTVKKTLNKTPKGWYAWFNAPNRQSRGANIIVGHWSALGLRLDKNGVNHIDTGCVWGKELTALRLPDCVPFSVAAVEPQAHSKKSIIGFLKYLVMRFKNALIYSSVAKKTTKKRR